VIALPLERASVYGPCATCPTRGWRG
jgi:hypothetical protein